MCTCVYNSYLYSKTQYGGSGVGGQRRRATLLRWVTLKLSGGSNGGGVSSPLAPIAPPKTPLPKPRFPNLDPQTPIPRSPDSLAPAPHPLPMPLCVTIATVSLSLGR